MERTVCGFLFENVIEYDEENNNFEASHGNKEIEVYCDEDGCFYFSVFDVTAGMHDADGYCSDEVETLDEAIEEMIQGACLHQG